MKKIENDLLKAKLNNLYNKIEKDGIFNTRKIRNDQKESFVFTVYSLQRIKNNYDLNDDFYDSITDGFDDNNIDIFDINIDDENNSAVINIAQTKYKTNDKSLNATITTTDIRLFEDSIKSLIINAQKNLIMNKFLEKQIKLFEELVKNKINLKINLYLITNGSELSENDFEKIKNFRNNSDFKAIDSYEFCNTYDFFIEDNTYVEKDIEIKTYEKTIGINCGGITAYIGNITAYQLYELFDTYKNKILAKNIRNLLKSDINRDIEKSIKDNPDLFWHKNNGISIICEKAELKTISGEHKLILKKPFIVNGGQTTKILYNLYKNLENDQKYNRDDLFATAKLLIRVYQTTDENIIEEITYGTNNQNKVLLSDKYSNNKNLKILQDLFKEQLNVFLILKSDTEINYSGYSDSINYEYLFQIYCSFYLGLSDKAKNSKTTLLKNYFKKTFEDNDQDINNKFIYTYKLYKFVSEKIKKLKNSSNANLCAYGLFSILYSMSLLDKNVKNVTEDLDTDYLDILFIKAFNIIDEIVKEEKIEKDNSFSYNNFFKSALCKDKITKKLNKETNNAE